MTERSARDAFERGFNEEYFVAPESNALDRGIEAGISAILRLLAPSDQDVTGEKQ